MADQSVTFKIVGLVLAISSGEFVVPLVDLVFAYLGSLFMFKAS